jgi:hypothetical protein
MLIRNSNEVGCLKHEQELLRQQLRDVKPVNNNIKNVLRGMTS